MATGIGQVRGAPHGARTLAGMDVTDRHPSTRAIARWFSYDHLPEGLPKQASKACADLAGDAIRSLPDGPELTTGLRKLLEAKDALVRAAIDAADDTDT